MRLRRTKVHEAKLADDVSEAVRRSHSRSIREVQNELDERQVAYGKVTGSTGAVTASFNVASVSRTATGSYTVTLAQPIDPNSRFISITVRSTSGAVAAKHLASTDTSTQFVVVGFTTTSGADADIDFAFRVESWD